ncbi:hypothetical protein ES708_15180 [subsurface metagenome]
MLPARIPKRSATISKVVTSRSRETLAPLIILRLMEYNPTIIRMPASKAGILSLVLSMPVSKPAQKPAPIAARLARKGFTPATIKTAATAPPRV